MKNIMTAAPPGAEHSAAIDIRAETDREDGPMNVRILAAAASLMLLQSTFGFAAGQSGANKTDDCAAGTSNTTKTEDCALEQKKQPPGASQSQNQSTPPGATGNAGAIQPAPTTGGGTSN